MRKNLWFLLIKQIKKHKGTLLKNEWQNVKRALSLNDLKKF